jgi:hypothetical protein
MALNNPKEFQSMRRSLIAALLASVIASPALAQGDAWPNRPITLMGGFPNGAGTDIYARRLAEPLSRALGQPVVVDSRTGPARMPSMPRCTRICPLMFSGISPLWCCSAMCPMS